MSMASWFRGGCFHIPGKTESAGTAITRLISPKGGYLTRITRLGYVCGATAHDIVILKPVAKTFFSADAAAAQKDIVLQVNTSGGGAAGLKLDGSEALAASDYLAWKNENGGYDFDIIASVATGTETVTLTNNLPVAVDEDDPVWAFYEVGRTTHMILKAAASIENDFHDPIAGLADSDEKNEPLLVYSANGSNAGVLQQVSGYYGYAGDDNINQVL